MSQAAKDAVYFWICGMIAGLFIGWFVTMLVVGVK
jgi:hypothetical protein